MCGKRFLKKSIELVKHIAEKPLPLMSGARFIETVLLSSIKSNLTMPILILDDGSSQINKARLGSFNESLNQVFARTIITSFTTLLVLVALLIAGGEALKNFSLALAVGVIVGSYSSIYIVVRVLLSTNLTKKDMEVVKNEPEESYSLD